MKSLRSIDRIRVFDQAIDQIRSAILNGEMAPNSRIPSEQELGEILAVGRSTIREALRVLEAEGLIEIKQGTGVFVADRTQWGSTQGEMLAWLAKREDSVIQILDVRGIVEGLTASLASKNMPREEIDTLKIINDQMLIKSITLPLDTNELSDLDVKFHLTISGHSNNDIADDILRHILPAFAKTNSTMLWILGRIEPVLTDHRAIVAAIESGNAQAAEKAMRKHISRVKRLVCVYLKQPCAEE